MRYILWRECNPKKVWPTSRDSSILGEDLRHCGCGYHPHDARKGLEISGLDIEKDDV
jgi:hypothetical protein